MRWLSFLKGIFGNPRQAFLKEAEALWPELVVHRKEELRSLCQDVEVRLEFLAEALAQRAFIDPQALKAYLNELLIKMYLLVNHALFFGLGEEWFPQRLEEIEGRLRKAFLGERGEPPLVCLLSQIDLEDEEIVGKPGALLGEVRNVLGLPVPQGLLFSKVALEELLRTGAERLPYKLQAEWRSALKRWSPKNTLGFYVLGETGPRAKVPPKIDSIKEALSACLPHLDPEKGLLVFEEGPGVKGTLWTTAPEDKTCLKLSWAEEEYLLPKPPPFEGKRLGSLTAQEVSTLCLFSFKLEHYFGRTVYGRFVRQSSKGLVLLDIGLGEELGAHTQSSALLLHGGVAIGHGLVSGVVEKEKSYPQAILVCSYGQRPDLGQRIKGLIWEAGDPLGPEAAFLRRAKIPSLFQVRGLERLKPGQEITLDTYAQSIYAGGGLGDVQSLPFGGAGVKAASGYRFLRRLMPLLLAQGPSSRSLKGILAALKDNGPA